MVGPVEKIQYGFKNYGKYCSTGRTFEYKRVLDKVAQKEKVVSLSVGG